MPANRSSVIAHAAGSGTVEKLMATGVTPVADQGS
jgi:hypothetical protein